MANFKLIPPPSSDPITSTSWREYFYQQSQYLNGVAKLTDDPQTFTGQNSVVGNFPGTGQLLVHQTIATQIGQLANNWAIVGWTDIKQVQTTSSSAVGGFFTGRAWNGGGSAWGIATEVWNGSPTAGTSNGCGITGVESAVVQGFDNNIDYVAGVGAVFKNRPDIVSQPFNGLGANKYANNSRAFDITSQVPSPLGELCGWSVGLMFNTNCMSPPLSGGTAVGIDMSRIPSSLMAIGLWVADGVKIQLSNTTDVGIKYLGGSILFGTNATAWLSINMTTGGLSINTPSSGTLATGAGEATPANVAGHINVTVNGVSGFGIPLYLVS